MAVVASDSTARTSPQRQGQRPPRAQASRGGCSFRCLLFAARLGCSVLVLVLPIVVGAGGRCAHQGHSKGKEQQALHRIVWNALTVWT